MSVPGSVTRWLDQLHAADAEARNQAAEELWGRPAHQLLALARSNLAPRLRQRVDAEDVWRLLVTITLSKSRNDLKPDNVMVGAFGEVLVLNGSLARTIQEGEIASRERFAAAGPLPRRAWKAGRSANRLLPSRLPCVVRITAVSARCSLSCP